MPALETSLLTTCREKCFRELLLWNPEIKVILSLNLKTSGGKEELRPNYCSFHALYRDILETDKCEDYKLVIQC